MAANGNYPAERKGLCTSAPASFIAGAAIRARRRPYLSQFGERSREPRRIFFGRVTCVLNDLMQIRQSCDRLYLAQTNRVDGSLSMDGPLRPLTILETRGFKSSLEKIDDVEVWQSRQQEEAQYMNDELLSPAKAELIRLIKRKGSVNVKEATINLELAASTIRQHLSGLEVDGFVDKYLNREGVGRPSKMYHLTEKAQIFFDNRESTLLTELIRELIASGEREKVAEFFSSNCDKILERWRRRLLGAPEGEKLPVIQELLQEWGYVPECRYDDEDRIVIELYHCPYPNVVDLVPYQCACEKRLLESLTGYSLARECSIPEGATSCRFREED